MYKVPFVLQFNFEYMKKEREKLKLSSKDFFSSQYSIYAGFKKGLSSNELHKKAAFLSRTN